MAVFCINTEHPEFRLLIKQTGLPVDYLRAVVSVWMDDNGTDQMPTADDLLLEVIDSEQLTSIERNDSSLDQVIPIVEKQLEDENEELNAVINRFKTPDGVLSLGIDLKAALNPIYSAMFLARDEEENLKKRFPPVHPNLFYHHSTIEFKPADINGLEFGAYKPIKILGRLTTDRVDVLLVENPKSKNKYPHITLSTAEGVKPFESNKALEENQDKIEMFPKPISVYAVEGVFNGSKDITSLLETKKLSIRDKVDFPMEGYPVETQDALDFAKEAHKTQTRKYTNEPYYNHLIAVASKVSEYTDDLDVIRAAFLHDTIEDTDVTYEQLVQRFGTRVADMVQELTDEYTKQNYPDLNRRMRKDLESNRLSKISSEAKLIKAADRLHNIQDIAENDPKFAIKYLEEAEQISKVIMDDSSHLHLTLKKQIESLQNQVLKNPTDQVIEELQPIVNEIVSSSKEKRVTDTIDSQNALGDTMSEKDFDYLYTDYLLRDFDFDDQFEKRREKIENKLAPNGKPSILYQDLLSLTNNERLATRLWLNFYTPEFRQWFGDWVAAAEMKIQQNNDTDTPKVIIKDGVKEVFDENPELANAVYEALGFETNITLETEKGSIYYLNNGKTKRDKKTLTGRIEKFSESDKTVYITEETFKILKENSEGLSDLEWTDNDVTVTNDSGRKTTISISNTPKIGLLPLELVKGVDETESGYREDKRINIKSYSFLPKGVSFHVGHKIVSINKQITPQQKQEAQQLYSQYLDTIFPESKVKDIVYHGTDATFEKFMKMYNNIHFGTLKAAKERLSTIKEQRKSSNENIYPVILDIKRPIITDADFDWELDSAGEQPDPYELITTVGYLDNWLYQNGYLPKEESDVFGLPDKSIPERVALWKNHDSYIYKNFVEDRGSKSYSVFEPEQIHILGNKQDVEGFKKFIKSGAPNASKLSQVVDSNGEPMIVYHGTNNPGLQQFIDKEDGYFQLKGGRIDAKFFSSRNPEDSIYQRETVLPVVLNIRNPTIRDDKNNRDGNPNSFVETINSAEGDGVIIKNTTDPFETDVYVAFKSDQIKSVFNKGTFQGDKIYHQLTSQSNEAANDELNEKITKFLEKIGVSVQSVDNIRDRNGNLLNAAAKADMLNKIIEVVNERAALDTLPEEAAHFFVEMLGENNLLYKEMYRKITDFAIYSQTMEEYKRLASYRNPDGTVNIDKIKKEAIGKAIAKHIIEGDQNESFKNLNLIEAIWEYIMEFVKSVFGISEQLDNPFQTAAEMIMDADVSQLDMNKQSEEEYYSQEDPLNNLIADQSKITIDDTIDPFTGEKKHTYFKDGIPARGSVTSFYVEPWLRKIFRKGDQRDEAQKLIDITKADFGDLIHLQFQELIKSWTKADGTMRSTQNTVTNLLPGGIYKTLNEYVQNLMAEFPEGTKFYPEIKIFDSKKKIGGTIDLLIVEPDGVASIYDWKSQEIYKNETDLKPYKEKMYRLQLDQYMKILSTEYGFEKFKSVRAIPVRTRYIYKNRELYGLNAIEIGNIDPQLIPEDKNYLLPVVIKTEETGDQQLDKLINQLNNILQKLEDSRTAYDKAEAYKKREEIKNLKTAIRDLQLRKRVEKFVILGMAQLKKYKERLENGTLTGNEIRESLRILEVFSKSSVMLHDLREEQLKALKENPKTDKKALSKFQELNKKFLVMSANVTKLIEDIKAYEIEKVKGMADEFGIKNIMNAEAELGFTARTFQSLSNINRKVYRAFSKLLRNAQQKRDIKTKRAVVELVKLKKNFAKWAKDKGLSMNSAMEMMLNLDDKGNWNGNFLPRYQTQYYKDREIAVKTGNVKWVLDNTSFDKEKYEESLENMKKVFNSIRYHFEEEENEKIIEGKIKDWIENHNVYNDKGELNIKALMNVEENRFLRPIDEWETDKWKTLFKKDSSGAYVNQPLVDTYNYFQGLLRQSKKLGMIDDEVRQFIPTMYASTMENIAFGDISGIFDFNSMAKLEVDSGTQYTPEVDPSSGEVINQIPVYFTKDVGVKREDGTWDYSKKSRDLFKVFGIWAGHMYNYEAMSSIEDDSLMLLDAERSKESLVTDNFNRIVIENNQVKKKSNNDANAQVLEEFVNYYLYDRQSGNLKDVAFRNRVAEAFDKLRGVEEKAEPKEYSLNKTVQTGINYFGIKTLALNLVSGLAQLVGGAGNVLFQGTKGQLFTTKTWMQAVHATIGSKKARAALEFLNITEGTGKEGMYNELSMVKGDRIVNKHNAFILQRLADKSITQPVAIALMMEHMLNENKEVINIARYVKDKYDYDNVYYNLSTDEQEKLRTKIDNEVDDLKKNKSLLAIGKLDKDGKFDIEGLDENNDSFLAFKDKINGTIKRIIGNTGRDDINNVRTGMLGSAAMQFRSWIPEMVEERFDALKYDDELQVWTYGKYNLFISELFSKNFSKIVKGIITGFGGVDIVSTAKQKYIDLKTEYRLKDQDFDISEAEFIDLYIGSMRSFLVELTVMIGIMLAVLSLTSGGDDDKKKSGLKKLMIRAFKKFQNEFLFYVNPREFTNLVSNPLPFLGVLEDFYTLNGAISKEIYGNITGDKEMADKAQPFKYLMKMFPVGKESMIIMAAFDDEFRKEYDIRLDNYFYR